MGTSEHIDFSQLRISRLEEEEKIESFDCGDADLNDFILREALLYHDALLAVTYVAKIGNEVLTMKRTFFILCNRTMMMYIPACSILI